MMMMTVMVLMMKMRIGMGTVSPTKVSNQCNIQYQPLAWLGQSFTNPFSDDNDDDGDGIADVHDNDDDGDGLNDDDGESTAPKKATKGNTGSGPWATIVFGYYFGLTHYLLKTA